MHRIRVWQDTEARAPSYPSEPSIKVRWRPERPAPAPRRTSPRVSAGDTLDAALHLRSAGLNPLVLNMADDSFPGGCVYAGSGAQEESIFRRTNLVCTLGMHLYPILGDQAVYSPRVSVFKSSEADGYRLHQPVDVSIISCPAIRHPDLVDGRFTDAHVAALTAKVELICQTAARFGHDALVLGAMGCGAWKCPPADVAAVMKTVLDRWAGYFEDVVIAILPGAEKGYTARTYTREDNNLPTFVAAFQASHA